MFTVQQFHERHLALFAEGRYADLPLSCRFPVGVDFERLHRRKLDRKYYGSFRDLFTDDFESKIAPELTPLSQHLLGGMHAAGRKIRDGHFDIELNRHYAAPMQPVAWHIDCVPLYSAGDYMREESRKWIHEGAQIFQTVVSEGFLTAVAPEDTFAGRPEGFDHALYVLSMLNAVMGWDVFIPWQAAAKEVGGNLDEARFVSLIDTMKLRGREIIEKRFVVAEPTPGYSTGTHFSYIAPHTATHCPLVTLDAPPPPDAPLHNQILLRSFPWEPK